MSLKTSPRQECPDHMERTSHNTRQEVISTATVTRLKQLSATVNGLQLKVDDRRFCFKAGQWLDMMIPGIETVGGFSMCSSPRKLRQDGVLDLAVKLGNHPPAAWVHHKCKEGDEVSIRAGGDFFYDPQPGESPTHLLLLAGGVGINPLISMVHHVTDLSQSNLDEPIQVRLLYSGKSDNELVFRETLMSIQDVHRNVKCKFYVTKEQSRNPILRNGRITKSDLNEAVKELGGVGNISCYICGPSDMISSMEQHLLTLHVPNNRILYEKWW